MISVKLDFEDRKKQIEHYLGFLWVSSYNLSIENLDGIANSKIIFDDSSEIELSRYLDSSKYIFNSSLIKILKSNTILLFYNLIEGTIVSLMNEYFNELNLNPTKFKNVKPELKKIWLRYKHKSFKTSSTNSNQYIIDTIGSILEELLIIEPKTIRDYENGTRTIVNFDAYHAETKSNEISGNLDAQKIRSLFNKFGLPQITLSCNSMLTVKNKRNSLAHGNETFTEVGGNFSIEDLFKMNKEIVGFLNHLIQEVENFLTTKSYKIANV